VLPKKLLVNTGLVVKSLKVRGGDELAEVLVSLFVLGPHHQVAVVLDIFDTLLGLMVAIGDIQFTANNGLDVSLTALVPQLYGTRHVSVVSQCHGIHAKRLTASNKTIDLRRCVQ
jgi:hypothetical protein